MKFSKLYNGKTHVIPANFFCYLMKAEGLAAAKCQRWSHSLCGLQYSGIFSILEGFSEMEVGVCAVFFNELFCYSTMLRTVSDF